MTDAEPRLYGELASWFHLLTAPEDYADEAELYRTLILEAVPKARTVLELGSGGGNNASHLKPHFNLTLVDRSPAMLELSAVLNPECEHVLGDMRSIRLGRTFDAVFIHDAIAYVTNEADLRAVVETAFVHCQPEGVGLFVPDYVRESFRPLTSHGGHDGAERGLRYVEWVWDPDPRDATYLVDFGYLLRDAAGEVRVEHDRHVCGLFDRRAWLRLLEDVGFRPEIRPARGIDHAGGELFVAQKPG